MKILITSRSHRNMFQMLPRRKRQCHVTNPVLLKIYLHSFLKVIPGFWIEELIPFTCNHELFAAYTCREKLIEMRSTKRYATVLNKPCESWAYQYVGGVKKLRDLSKYFKWVRLLYFRYILSRKMTLQQLDLFIPFVSFNVAKFHCYKYLHNFSFLFQKQQRLSGETLCFRTHLAAKFLF